jgi:hypothetical protein
MPTSASLKKSRSSSLEPEQVVSLVSPMMIHLEEQRRREERERQKVARDYAKLREEQAGRGSLLNFVRYYWHVLEPPKRKLVEGWPLEAVALHLEAITFGDIRRAWAPASAATACASTTPTTSSRSTASR